jgi:protein CpxP
MSKDKAVDAKAGVMGRWVRRAGVLATVAALAGSASWHAYAHGGPGHRGGGGFFGGMMQGAPSEERIERMLKHLYVEMNATPEQQQRIAPIVKQAVSELAPLRKQLQGTREQVRSLMSAEQIDRAAIEQLRASRLQAADTISRRMTQAMADIAEVLTPEQRKAMAERMQQRRGTGEHGQHGRRG